MFIDVIQSSRVTPIIRQGLQLHCSAREIQMIACDVKFRDSSL